VPARFVEGVGWQRINPVNDESVTMHLQTFDISIPERAVCNISEYTGFSDRRMGHIELNIENTYLVDLDHVLSSEDGAVWRWVSEVQRNIHLGAANQPLESTEQIISSGSYLLRPPLNMIPCRIQFRNNNYDFRHSSNLLNEVADEGITTDPSDCILFNFDSFDPETGTFSGGFDVHNPYPKDLNFSVDGESVQIGGRTSYTHDWSCEFLEALSFEITSDEIDFFKEIGMEFEFEHSQILENPTPIEKGMRFHIREGIHASEVEGLCRTKLVRLLDGREIRHEAQAQFTADDETKSLEIRYPDLPVGTWKIKLTLEIFGNAVLEEYQLDEVMNEPVPIEMIIKTKQFHSSLDIKILCVPKHYEFISSRKFKFDSLNFRGIFGHYNAIPYESSEHYLNGSGLGGQSILSLKIPLYDRKTIGWLKDGGKLSVNFRCIHDDGSVGTHTIEHVVLSKNPIYAMELIAPNHENKTKVLWGEGRGFPKCVVWYVFHPYKIYGYKLDEKGNVETNDVESIRVHRNPNVHFLRPINFSKYSKTHHEKRVKKPKFPLILQFTELKQDLVQEFSNLIFILNEKYWFEAKYFSYTSSGDLFETDTFYPQDYVNDWNSTNLKAPFITGPGKELLDEITALNEKYELSYESERSVRDSEPSIETFEIDYNSNPLRSDEIGFSIPHKRTRYSKLKELKRLQEELNSYE